MKRVITTFAILLVVIIVGMTALVILVNPNDFKSYMVRQVESRSGYQLQLSGDLRWHIWPKLSILSGQVSLTAPGASQAAVTAENMRLDVELLPLLSHQLRVSQVVLDNAVIQATPQSAAHSAPGTPIAPDQSGYAAYHSKHWTLDIARLNIVNSLFVWQDPQGNQINFRQLNLFLDQHQPQAGTYQFSTRVTRNQQNLQLDVEGSLDARNYPDQLLLNVSRGRYRLDGAGLPISALAGTLAFNLRWLPAKSAFEFNPLALQANDSDFSGSISGRLLPAPVLTADLHAEQADFDALYGHANPAAKGTAPTRRYSVGLPVIADIPLTGADNWLDNCRIETRLIAANSRWHGVILQDLKLHVSDHNGMLRLHQLEGKAGAGQFAVNGQTDLRTDTPEVAFNADLRKIPLPLILSLTHLPQKIDGALSFQGQFQGKGLSGPEMLQQWQGQGSVVLNALRVPELNLQQMLTETVRRTSDRVHMAPDITAVSPELTGDIKLRDGKLKIMQLTGRDTHLQIETGGEIDFREQSLDITFNLLLSGWRGDQQLVEALSSQPVPLRFYGPWNRLQYSLSVNRILRGSLKDKFHRWLKQTDAASQH